MTTTDHTTEYTAPPTWEALRDLWVNAIPNAGPSERFDREQNFWSWVALHAGLSELPFEVRYEVWRNRGDDTGWTPTGVTTRQRSRANIVRDEYTAEAAENARMEQRPVRTRFATIEATTARRVLP